MNWRMSESDVALWVEEDLALGEEQACFGPEADVLSTIDPCIMGTMKWTAETRTLRGPQPTIKDLLERSGVAYALLERPVETGRSKLLRKHLVVLMALAVASIATAVSAVMLPLAGKPGGYSALMLVGLLGLMATVVIDAFEQTK